MGQVRRRLNDMAISEIAPPEPVMLPVHFVWRGREIRTPYFAAAGGDPAISKPNASELPSSVCPPPTKPLNAMGMLEALHFYKIPGWTSDFEK